MSNDVPWKELDERDIRAGAQELKNDMRKSGVDEELAQEVLAQVSEITQEMHNIIFVFTDGKWAVTGIHVPDEAIGDEESPVLIKGANPRHIIAAFPESEIREKIKIADGVEIITGLTHDADSAWVEELENMCKTVKMKIRNNPPREEWEDLLK